jgi:hypothetical protein
MRTWTLSPIVLPFDRSGTLPSVKGKFTHTGLIELAVGTFRFRRYHSFWSPVIFLGSSSGQTVVDKSLTASQSTDSPWLHLLLIGLLVTLMTLVQVAVADSLSTDGGRVDQPGLTVGMHEQIHTISAGKTSDVPCTHHESESQCAPCPHCSTPAAEATESFDLSVIDVRSHGPLRLTQYFPASLFKPPRRIR